MSAKLSNSAQNSQDTISDAAQGPHLLLDTAANPRPSAWLTTALTLCVCLVTIGPGALPYDVCINASEVIVALCLTTGLFTGLFRGTRSNLDIFAAGWLSVQICSSIWAVHTSYYLFSPYTARMYNGGTFGPFSHTGDVAASVGLYLIVSRYPQSSRGSFLLPLIASTVGVAILASIEEVRNLAYGTSDPRIQGTFTNPNLLAAYVCFALPISLSMVIDRGIKLQHRAIRAVLAKSMIAVVLLTQSRGAIIGCVVGCIFVFFAHGKHHFTLSKTRSVLLFSSISIAALIACFLVFPRLLHQGRSVSDGQRETAWKGAIEIIEQHPFTGLGDGAYPAALGMLHLKEPNTTTSNGYPLIPSMHLHAHDLLLQSWVERGIAGTILIIWMITFIASSAIKNLQNHDPKAVCALQIGAIGALLATLCQNTPDYTLWYCPISMIFWYVLAFVSEVKPPDTPLIIESATQDTKRNLVQI